MLTTATGFREADGFGPNEKCECCGKEPDTYIDIIVVNEKGETVEVQESAIAAACQKCVADVDNRRKFDMHARILAVMGVGNMRGIAAVSYSLELSASSDRQRDILRLVDVKRDLMDLLRDSTLFPATLIMARRAVGLINTTIRSTTSLGIKDSHHARFSNN